VGTPPPAPPIATYVLDAFAIVAYLRDEPAAEAVAHLLRGARAGRVRLLMHWINLGEVYYTVRREEGPERAAVVLAQVKGYPMTLVSDCSEEFLLAAADLKATHPISYADAFAVALAARENAILATEDPELKPLGTAGVVRLAWIGAQ
jgi:predicted nucleic acid-binding protein